MVAIKTKIYIGNAAVLGRRARRRRQGASLVEVLVVLAIIVGGLLLALQVFPVGFGQIKASGNRTLATQLAEQMMGQVNGDDANLPMGIVYKYFDANNNLVSLTEVDPDNLAPCRFTTGDKSTPASPCVADPTIQGATDYDKFEATYVSDVNKFRFIEGEAVKVPLPAPGGFGSGSVYACKFGPMLMNQTVGDPANVPNTGNVTAFNSFLRVNGAPMTGVVVQANPGSDGSQPGVQNLLRSQQTYLIDYGSDDTGSGDEPIRVMFPARGPRGRQNPNRVFKVTVTYDKGNENLSTESFDVVVADSNTPIWQTLTNAATNTVAVDGVPGSETVQREFQRLARPTTGNPAWDRDDPYEYVLLSDNIQTNAVQGANKVFANMGVIAFNPAGGTYAETVANGTTRPFTAYIDYATLDWHILRDDREVPSALPDANGFVPIRTTLGTIRGFGETNVDSTTYAGLYGVGTQTDPQDIQVFNLDAPTGVPLIAGDYGNGTPTPTADANGADYYIQRSGRGGTFGTGTIYINTARLRPGTHLRVLYKARGDWAVALQKAYSQYTLAADPRQTSSPSPLPLRGNYNNYARNQSLADPQIRFPISDANKSFVVSIQYTTSDGRVRRLSPIQMVASMRSSDVAEADPNNVFDHNFVYIQVNKYLTAAQQSELAGGTGWSVAGPISGVSLKARVIWHDNDNIQNRWRVQDMDTVLTPSTL